MKPISEKAFEKELKKIKDDNIYRLRRLVLKEERNKYKSKVKLPTWSKMLAVYLFTILNVVLVFAMVAMWRFGDLQYLGTLISDIAGQVLVYFIYAKKSTIENTTGGITYELAMQNKNEEAEG